MSIEAMKLALEALELFCECGTMDRPIERREALRQAIEQAQKQEPVAWKDAMKVAFWRMYEHGKNDNPVSAQCEVQALGMLCNGEFDDITAWHPSQWKLPPQRQPLTDVHRESGMTSDELWLSNGKLRAEMADLKVQLKQLRENERQVCADELMAFANRHRNLHSAGMTDLDHCVVYTLETNAYLLRTRFYENHLPKEAAHGIKE